MPPKWAGKRRKKRGRSKREKKEKEGEGMVVVVWCVEIGGREREHIHNALVE